MWTEGEKRADRIIDREMWRVGLVLRRTRNGSFAEWCAAHLELEELWKACKLVHGQELPPRKTPNLESKRQHDGAGRNRGLFDAN